MKTITQLTNEQITDTWKEVFPNSLMLCNKACLGDSYYFKGKLAANRHESANQILENDPLYYVFCIDDGDYSENMCFIYVKPTKNMYLCYERVNLRRKSIKSVTVEKLRKRFLQIKELVVANKDNFKNLCFDINEKI